MTFNGSQPSSVKSISIDGLHFEGTIPPATTADGNGGLRLDKIKFVTPLEFISIKNIEQNEFDNNQTYYGIREQGSTLDVAQLIIDKITTQSPNGKAYGANFMGGGSLGYNTIKVSNISAGENATGLSLSNTVAPLGENRSIAVKNISANQAFGITSNYYYPGNSLKTKHLLVDTVMGKKQAAGITFKTMANVDELYIRNVKADDESRGLYLSGNKANLTGDVLDIASVSITDGILGKAYGIVTENTCQNEFHINALNINGVSGKNAEEAYGIRNNTGAWSGNTLNITNVSSGNNGKAIGLESFSELNPGSMSEGPTSFDYGVMTISNISGGNAAGLYNRNKGIKATVCSHRLVISDVTGENSAVGLHNAFVSNNYSALSSVNITKDTDIEQSGLLSVQNIISTSGNATGAQNDSLIDTNSLTVNNVEAKNGIAVGIASTSSLTVSDQTIISKVKGKTQAIGVSLIEDKGTLGETNISEISADDKAIGLNIQSTRDVAFSKPINLSDIKSASGIAAAIHADNLKLSGGSTLTGIEGGTCSCAVLAKATTGSGVIIEAENDVTNVVEGDLVTETNGKISAAFRGAGSHLKGATDLSYQDGDADGQISMSFKNSRWDVTKSSNLSSLSIDNSTLAVSFNLNQKDAPETTNIDVKGEASGTFNLALKATGVIGDDYVRSPDWILQQDSGILTVGDVLDPEGAALDYTVRFFEDGASENSEGSATSTGQKGQWYVVVNKKQPDVPDVPNDPGVAPEDPPISGEVAQVLALGASVNQGLGMLSETEDLRMRMGDIRHDDTDGLWVRTSARKDSAHGSFGNGFEQDTYGIHLGADHVVKSADDASWLLGGAFHYGRTDMDGTADAAGGSADVDQYTFKAYATYMKDNGAFLDLVLHAGYYDTELTGLANSMMAGFKADYSNGGYGVSAEAGHRFEFGKTAREWYVEPTVQLTWFHADGKNFTTSTGLAIAQSDADFITGRVGATIGKTFALGNESDPMASYFSIGLKGGMLYQFDGDQKITAHGTDGATVRCNAMDLKGARAYYGLTADWKIDNSWRIYGQISREEGSGYTKDYDAGIGVRYSF